MKKIILTTVAAASIISTVPMALASDRHHVRKLDRAPVSQQFRNANNAVVHPAPGYEFHGYSAPAGR